MEKHLGAWNGELLGVYSWAFTDCACYSSDAQYRRQIAAPLRSVMTVRTPSRRVLKLPPVARWQDMAWLSWALCLLEGAHRRFHAGGAVLMSLREVFFEVPRRGRCCVVRFAFFTQCR